MSTTDMMPPDKRNKDKNRNETAKEANIETTIGFSSDSELGIQPIKTTPKNPKRSARVKYNRRKKGTRAKYGRDGGRDRYPA